MAKSPLLISFGLWLFFVGLYAWTDGGRFFSVDEVAVYQTARYFSGLSDEPIAPSVVTRQGPDGRNWGMHGPVASLLAAPLYGLGSLLQSILPERWSNALAGEILENDQGVRWGGDVHIVAVSLLNVLVTATLLVVFLFLLLELGHSLSMALLSSLVVGLTSILAAYSKNLLTHSLVALFLLSSLLYLVMARKSGAMRHFVAAGVLSGLMVLTRTTSAVAVPWLFGYAMIGTFSASRTRRGSSRVWRFLAFTTPLVLAAGGVFFYNHLRFGNPFDLGYTHFGGFQTHPLVGLFGHLFSVGRSFLLYSPPLLLALPFLGRLARERRAEFWVVLGISLSMLGLYSVWYDWQGGWCWGNRFLVPCVPLLLLAFPWALEYVGKTRNPWLIGLVALILLAGLGIQILGLGVNISFVYQGENLWNRGDGDAYLWMPQLSQPAAHFRALTQGRWIDFWWYRTHRDLGMLPTLVLMAPCLLSMGIGALMTTWGVARNRTRQPESPLQ